MPSPLLSRLGQPGPSCPGPVGLVPPGAGERLGGEGADLCFLSNKKYNLIFLYKSKKKGNQKRYQPLNYTSVCLVFILFAWAAQALDWGPGRRWGSPGCRGSALTRLFLGYRARGDGCRVAVSPERLKDFNRTLSAWTGLGGGRVNRILLSRDGGCGGGGCSRQTA